MIEKKFFGKTKTGEDVYEYIIFNDKIQVNVLSYGAVIKNLLYKGKDIVLGYDNLCDYEDNPNYFGTNIGRCSNRIENANFTIDGKQYTVEANDRGNHLHGGSNAIHKKIWTLKNLTQESMTLKHIQRQEDDGYPGDLTIYAHFEIKDDKLFLKYEYSCNENSVADITGHSYFNLNSKDDILSHKLKLNSSFVTVFDEFKITTGQINPVNDTAFDFRQNTSIGENLDKNKEELEASRGYDHNFIVDVKTDDIVQEDENLNLNATITDDYDKLSLKVYSNSPCFQLYTGNFIEDVKGKANKIYNNYAGLCIEPQFIPNSINMPVFNSPKIIKDKLYKKIICYKFNELK